jgi:predicted component of type VI protein secretion system
MLKISKIQKIVEQVHWCEGMLLSQHHFQQTAINLAQSLAHQLQISKLCHQIAADQMENGLPSED